MTSAGVFVSAATQGHEAKLEGAGVERGEDIAEMIVGGRTVHIGPKPPQQFDLALAKPRHVGERLRPRENRQKNQEKHFRQRIIHFAGLTMVRQPLEMVKKTRRLRKRCKSCPRAVHHRPPPPTQWITPDSALQPFVTNLFTRLP